MSAPARSILNQRRAANDSDHCAPDEREFTMTITPRELLDTSIGQLRTLAAFLSDQLSESSERTKAVSLETRACRQIQCSLSMLISELAVGHSVNSTGNGVWTTVITTHNHRHPKSAHDPCGTTEATDG
jgi:hypothetical protein